MPDAAAITEQDDDDEPSVDLGEIRWNLKRGYFHSEHLGPGKIVSVIDEDAEAYDLEEIDDDVRPVAAVIELLEGQYAGRFIDIDISEPDLSIPAGSFN